MTYIASDSSWLTTNETGDETGFWGYDAFGTVAFGTPTSAFGFGGQYSDASTGLSNLRARFYAPQTGTFTTRDPVFSVTDTAYTYSGDDPVNGSDPLGLCSEPGTGEFLVPGNCDWSSASWVDQAEATIGAQAGDGFSFTNGFRALADFGAGAANAVVSGVTLGAVHVSDPDCGYSWAYDTGGIYADVSVGLLGGGGADVEEGITAADQAAALQGSGDYAGVDAWENVTLKAGTIVHAGEPGVTGFATSDAAAESVGDDATALSEGLQIKPFNGSYRPGLTAFQLTEDVSAARSIALANPQFGAGGLEQLFIPNLEGVSNPLVTRLMFGGAS